MKDSTSEVTTGSSGDATWSYCDAYYAPNLEGLDFTIVTDATRGKGLFASVDVPAGATLLEETALCCCQNLDDRVGGVPVCGTCLRSLEAPLETLLRVRGADVVEGVAPRLRAAVAEEPFRRWARVGCRWHDGCEELFCSARCREEGWRRYHAAHAGGTRSAATRRFLRYDWTQDGVDFSDTASLALRIVQQVLCVARGVGGGAAPPPTLAEASQPYDMLVHAPLERFTLAYLLASDDDKDGEAAALPCAATAGGRDKARFLREVAAMMWEVCDMAAAERAYFSAARVSRLMGAVLLNGQERSPPSELAFAAAALQSVAGAAAVRELLGVVGADSGEAAAAVDAAESSARGQGIYAVASLFNHSCAPNVQITYTGVSDETLAAVALRDVRAGEELCISYIDETDTRRHRRRALRDHYLFECQCSRCSASNSEE